MRTTPGRLRAAITTDTIPDSLSSSGPTDPAARRNLSGYPDSRIEVPDQPMSHSPEKRMGNVFKHDCERSSTFIHTRKEDLGRQISATPGRLPKKSPVIIDAAYGNSQTIRGLRNHEQSFPAQDHNTEQSSLLSTTHKKYPATRSTSCLNMMRHRFARAYTTD